MNQARLLPNPEDWLDATVARKTIGLSSTHFYRLVETRAIRQYRVGAARVYWRAEIENYAKARKLIRG